MSDPTKSEVCRGPSRRAMLRAGLFGAWSLAFEDLLRLRARANGPVTTFPPSATNCILIWLAGGPSHIDTFDPKPEASVDVRGEFKPISTSVPGLQISEVFPKLARVMDRMTLIRGVTSPEADHDRAAHHMLTGYRPTPAQVYPGYGSVVSKTREAYHGALPTYVAMPDAPLFSSSGYLTPAYDPVSYTHLDVYKRQGLSGLRQRGLQDARSVSRRSADVRCDARRPALLVEWLSHPRV